MYTAISRKVSSKKCALDNPKGSIGYDQYIVLDTGVVESTSSYFPLALANYVLGLLYHSLKFF